MDTTNSDLENLGEYSGLEKTLDKLLSPGGCPWDREQTHDSLKRNLLEECYELIEAIGKKDIPNMVEELGDILMQIVFHIHIGQQSGMFTARDVFENINHKLIRRHPHVFGEGETRTAEEVKVQWEDIKQKEKKDLSSGSRLDSVPKTLPALAYAQLVQDRAHLAGFDWDNYSGVLDKIAEEIDELNEAQTEDEKANEMGDVLFSLVNAGRWLGIQAEDSLRKSNAKFNRRFTYIENTSRERGLDFKDLTMSQKESLWNEAKEIVG
jgi:tetrapyrrole methylase family protein/MazG family protein